MKTSSMVIVGLLMLFAGIFLSFVLLEDHRIFAQVGIPSDSILLNNTNMTAQLAPTITENTTITPAPESTKL